MFKTKKREGASTVLVLFMVVVLVTLGFFTIVSASLNYRLSLKASKWNKDYYALDSQGEALAAKIDDALYNAEQDAVTYVMDYEYKKNSTDKISLEAHQINKTLYSGNDENVYKVLNNTYKYLAKEYLIPVSEEYYSEIVTLYNDDNSIYSIQFNTDLKKDDDETYRLAIKLNVDDILYDIHLDDNGRVVGKKIDFENRYSIKKWQQYYYK